MPKQVLVAEPIKIYQPVQPSSKKIRNRYGSTNPRGEVPTTQMFSPKLSDGGTEYSNKISQQNKQKPVSGIKKLQQSQIQTMKKIKNENNSE